MPMSEADLTEFLKRKAQEAWSESSEPYYLAMVQPDLAKSGLNYKDAIREMKLSEFANKSDEFNFVRHPKKFAKIGVVPLGKEYSFPELDRREVEIGSVKVERDTFAGRERVVMDFLRLLSNLDEDNLRGFSIPASVIAGILKGK